jgi:hypothetical protein
MGNRADLPRQRLWQERWRAEQTSRSWYAMPMAGSQFEAVLVRDVSRWGRFLNIDESAYWEFLLLIHGVRLYYVQETFRDDRTPYANLD